MSRFSSVGGPTPGIERFLAAHPDFVADREREPFYTQHPGGYLRRLQVGTAQVGTAQVGTAQVADGTALARSVRRVRR